MRAVVRRLVGRLVRRQRGAAMVWLAVMLPFFLSIVGLAVDGGAIFKARRDLQDVADSAARAAAMQIDQNVYRASSGSTIVIDPSAARAVAGDYLGQVHDVDAQVNADQREVTVQVQRKVPTAFLRIVHIDSAQIGAVAVALPRHGIQQEQRP